MRARASTLTDLEAIERLEITRKWDWKQKKKKKATPTLKEVIIESRHEQVTTCYITIDVNIMRLWFGWLQFSNFSLGWVVLSFNNSLRLYRKPAYASIARVSHISLRYTSVAIEAFCAFGWESRPRHHYTVLHNHLHCAVKCLGFDLL